MEKGYIPQAKGSGIPVPVGLQKSQEAHAGLAMSDSAGRRKQFRFLAAFVLAVVLGFLAFSFMHRSLEIARLSHFYEKTNPDARGRLTVEEAESKFL
jgi:hypothetical protein